MFNVSWFQLKCADRHGEVVSQICI